MQGISLCELQASAFRRRTMPTTLEVDTSTNLPSPLLSSPTTTASYSAILTVLEEALNITDELGSLNGGDVGMSDVRASNRSIDSNRGGNQSSSNDEHHLDWSQ